MGISYLPHNDYRSMRGMGRDLADLAANLLLNYFQGARNVLDLGSGKGRLVSALAKGGVNAYGVDLRNAMERDEDRLVIADARALPFADRSFDLVTERMMLMDMLELQGFPKEEFAKIGVEAWRVLRPGGSLVLFQPPKGYIFISHLAQFRYEEITPYMHAYTKVVQWA
jgi:ubiquinone/menaquinone biosynthesis C-methylase UbiE